MNNTKRSSERRARQDGGQVTVFLALAGVALGAVMLLLVAELGGVAHDRARARTAADASALAGAHEGRAEADLVAHANGATIESYEVDGSRTTVRVRVGRAQASATAERSWQAPSASLTRFPVAAG